MQVPDFSLKIMGWTLPIFINSLTKTVGSQLQCSIRQVNWLY